MSTLWIAILGALVVLSGGVLAFLFWCLIRAVQEDKK